MGRADRGEEWDEEGGKGEEEEVADGDGERNTGTEKETALAPA